MHKLEKTILAALLFSLFAASFAFAEPIRERNRDFFRGRGGFRGNERSERPGRFFPGRLQHAGNGCPDGTMRAVFAPDGLSFTILFDQFVADTADGGRRASMACNALLPITIPEGQRMEITRVDYRGFVNVPARGKASLRSVFNFVERRGGERDKDKINIRFNFSGPVAENYELSTGDLNDGRGPNETEVSPCGGDTFLRIRNEAQVVAPRGEQAQLTVDSIDGSSNAVYYLNWRACRHDGRKDRDERWDRENNGRGRGGR